MISDELKNTLEEFIDKSNNRRNELQVRGARLLQWGKGIQIASGILALFSGSAITIALQSSFQTHALQWIAAGIAFLSGVLALVATVYLSETHISAMLTGSAEFLSLRDRAKHLLLLNSPNPDIVTKKLAKLDKEYQKLYGTYVKYLSTYYHRARSWRLP